jgi:anti-anti-sigma factor
MLLSTDCAEAEAVDGGIVVRLNSLTDHQKFVALLLELDIFVREAQPPRVVIDLSGSGFIQSRTLGEIARLANTAARAKTKLVLCSTNPLVQKVMTTTELDKLVTVCESVNEAKDIWENPGLGIAAGDEAAEGGEAAAVDAAKASGPMPGRYGLPRNFFKFIADRDRQLEVESFPWGNMNWLAGPPITPSALLHVARVQIKPNCVWSFHQHPDMEEVIIVTSGQVEQWIDQKSQVLQAGESATIPQNIVHATFNNEMQPADIIMIHCPARTDESSTVSVVAEEPWRTILRRRQYPNLDIVWKGKNLFARVTNHKILDSASTDAFRSSMLSLEADGQPKKFIIDFQEAWILSNTVLGVLGELQHRMNDGHRTLCVCGLSNEALKNFRKTRLSEFVVMYDSVKDALADLNKSKESVHRRDDSASEDEETSEDEPDS